MRGSLLLASFCGALLLWLCPQTALGVDALALQQNGCYATTDGQDVFFFAMDQDRWCIQSVQGAQAGTPPRLYLDAAEEPYGLLAADDTHVWYARYDARRAASGEETAPLAFVRRAWADGGATVLVQDVAPDSLIPTDGQTLLYSPWFSPNQLAKVDFIAMSDTLIAEAGAGQVVWDASWQENAYYLVLYEHATGRESLVRIDGAGRQTLPVPTPLPSMSVLCGAYRLYTATEQPDQVFVQPLASPERVYTIQKSVADVLSLYRHPSAAYDKARTATGHMALYRLPLGKDDPVRMLELTPPQSGFAFGMDTHELITLDRDGRLLSVTPDFDSLSQVAQLDPTALFAQTAWFVALPLQDCVVLLGDSFSPARTSRFLTPPDTVRIVPRGEGLAAPEVPLSSIP